MKVVIIEDESSCATVLQQELTHISPAIEVIAVLPGIKEAVSFFTDLMLPIDLIFMDIKLTDGYAFEIFNYVSITQPIIVVTAYNEYILKALKLNSVDFLLKPINKEELLNALKKIQNLKNHFLQHNFAQLTEQLSSKSQKIVVKKGAEYQTIHLHDVVYFFVDNKIVYCVDKCSKKYITEFPVLSDAYEKVDRNVFFKANRKYIINSEYIRKFKYIEFGKTYVELEINPGEDIIISQLNSILFRNWIRHI